MSQISDDLDRLRMFTIRQDAEAKLHWQRNSYFLVVISILVLAYSQSPTQNLFILSVFRVLVAVLGFALSLIWLFIQHRSSKYVLYYKNQARQLAQKTGTPDVYPKDLGGYEMRKLAYFLPIVFLVFWSALMVIGLT